MHLLYKSIFIILSFLSLSSCLTIKTAKELSKEYFNIANEYFELKLYSKAVPLYEKSIEYNKKDQKAIVNLIISLQEDKKYDDAENHISSNYTKIIDDFSDKLLLLLAKNYYLKNKYEESIEIFTRYEMLHPKDKIPAYNIGLNYIKLNLISQAHESFLRSYSLDNSFVPALYNITNYYMNKKDYKEALDYAIILASKEKTNPEILFLYSKILYNLDEMEKAKEIILKAIEINKENGEYDIFAAKIYAKGFNDKNKSLSHIDIALSKGKKTSDISSIEEFESLRENYKEEYNNVLKKYFKTNN